MGKSKKVPPTTFFGPLKEKKLRSNYFSEALFSFSLSVLGGLGHPGSNFPHFPGNSSSLGWAAALLQQRTGPEFLRLTFLTAAGEQKKRFGTLKGLKVCVTRSPIFPFLLPQTKASLDPCHTHTQTHSPRSAYIHTYVHIPVLPLKSRNGDDDDGDPLTLWKGEPSALFFAPHSCVSSCYSCAHFFYSSVHAALTDPSIHPSKTLHYIQTKKYFMRLSSFL